MRSNANRPDLLITRRSFLFGLLAIGLLPVPQAKVGVGEDEAIRLLQEVLGREPLHLHVYDSGTIELANYVPSANRLLAYDVSPKELELDDSVYDFLDRIEALRREVYSYSQELRDGEGVLEDWDTENVAEFIDGLRPAELEELRAHLLVWFSEDVTLEERDDGDIVRPIDGQQWAFRIFRDQDDHGILDDLKIVAVEGEVPGSTYYAAELKSDVDQANRDAARLGLPIIFEQCGSA